MDGVLYLNRGGKVWTKNVITRIDENYTPVYNASEAMKYFTTQEVVFKTNKDEFWPVPQQERDANPNLDQNPGYD
jgi:cytochrome c-type biogenesis protein CcmE